MLEAYAAYWDYGDMMRLTEELITSLSQVEGLRVAARVRLGFHSFWAAAEAEA